MSRRPSAKGEEMSEHPQNYPTGIIVISPGDESSSPVTDAGNVPFHAQDPTMMAIPHDISNASAHSDVPLNEMHLNPPAHVEESSAYQEDVGSAASILSVQSPNQSFVPHYESQGTLPAQLASPVPEFQDYERANNLPDQIIYYDRISLHRVKGYIVENDVTLTNETRALLLYNSIDDVARVHSRTSRMAFSQARDVVLEQTPSPFIYLSPSPAQKQHALNSIHLSQGPLPPVLTINNAEIQPHTAGNGAISGLIPASPLPDASLPDPSTSASPRIVPVLSRSMADGHMRYSRPPFASEYMHYQITLLFTELDPNGTGYIPLSAFLAQCLDSASTLLPPHSQAALSHDLLCLYAALRDTHDCVHDKYTFGNFICPTAHDHIPDCSHGLPFTPASLVGFMRLLNACYTYAQVHVISLAQLYDLLCLFYRVESQHSHLLPAMAPREDIQRLVVRKDRRTRYRTVCCCWKVKVRNDQARIVANMHQRQQMQQQQQQLAYSQELNVESRSAATIVPSSMPPPSSPATNTHPYMFLDDKEANEVTQCCSSFHECWRSNYSDKQLTLPCFQRMFTRIEAQFGPAVLDYFFFAQSLLFLNLIGALLMSVLFIPAMIEFDWSVPDLTIERIVNGVPEQIVVHQSLQGILVGTGMEGSFMFYSDLYRPFFDMAAGIRVDLAWVFICMAFLFVSLVDSLSRFSIATEASMQKTYMFSRTLFAGFSFNQSSQTDYDWQRTRLAIAFQTLQAQQEDIDSIVKSKERFAVQKLMIGMRRFVGLLFCLGFLVGCAYLVTYLILEEDSIRDAFSALSFIAEFVVPFCVNSIQMMIPYFINFTLNFEKYDTRAAVFKHFLFRLFVMKMFFVLVVLFQTQALDASQSLICLQTTTGVLYYRILVVDFATDFLTCLIFPWMFLKMRQCAWKKKYETQFALISRRPDEMTKEEAREASFFKMLLVHDPHVLAKFEFSVAENTLDLMYRQALVWAAYPFTPVICILAMFTYVVTILLKYVQIVTFNRTPFRPVAILSQNNMFRTYFVATLCIMCIPFTFWLRQTVDCGPHKITECINGVCDSATPLQSILRWINTLPVVIRTIVDFIQSAAFLWAVILLGIINVVYLSKLWHGHNTEVSMLNEDVNTERQEWQFLRLSAPDSEAEQARGKDMFISCIKELPVEWGARAQASFARRGLDSMLSLKRMDMSHVEAILRKDCSLEAENAMLKLLGMGLSLGVGCNLDVVMEVIRELVATDGKISVREVISGIGLQGQIPDSDVETLEMAWEGRGGQCEACGVTPCMHYASPKLITQQLHSFVSIAMTIIGDWINKRV